MSGLEDIASWQDNPLVLVLALLLAAVLIGLLISVARNARQRRYLDRQERLRRDIAGRRRIKATDKQEVFERDNYTCQICGISKDFLDSLCDGLGDYLLLEADHIQSVKQGGTGRDLANLQCLCWRCNRKKGGTRTNEEVKAMIDYGAEYLRMRNW